MSAILSQDLFNSLLLMKEQMPGMQANRVHTPRWVALVVALVTAVVAGALIWRVDDYRLQERRAEALMTASNSADLIQRNIDRALSATHALAALVRQGNGSVPDFDKVAAEMLPRYPGVAQLLLAPGGIIQSSVPLSESAKELGINVLQHPSKRTEALLARESGELTLAGPLELLEGGVGLVGRLPVFLTDASGKADFWGFTLAVLPAADVPHAAGIAKLAEQGYAYELWRIHPDGGSRQTIAASSSATLVDPVTHAFQVPNASWNLSVVPVSGWRNPWLFPLEVAFGMLFTLLFAYLAKLMVEARIHATELEGVVAVRTAEVRARETELARALSIGRIGSWVLDLTGNVVSYSPETLRILGLSAGPPPNYRDLLQLIHADDRGAVERGWQELLKGERVEIEYRILAGSQMRWLRAQAELQFAPDRTPWRCAGTVEDITERKQATEALSARELQLSLIYDNAHEVIAVIGVEPNDQFRFVSVNRRFTEETGQPQDQVVGKLVQEIMPEPGRAIALGKIKEAIRTRLPVQWEDVSTFPIGNKVGEMTVAPVFDTNGNCTELIATVHDITERTRAETRYRTLLEWSPQALVVHRGGYVIYANPAAIKAIGATSAQDLLGKPVLDLVHPDFHDAVRARAQAATERNISLPMLEEKFLKLDGTVIDVEVQIIPIDFDGAPAILTAPRDITEQKRAKEQAQKYLKQLQTALMSTVGVATTLSEMRDPYTAGHERRVAEIAVAIGASMGLDEHRIEGLRIAGHLHDIGKMSIPAEILSKPGKLSQAEFQLIKDHPQAGYDVLKTVEFPWPVAEVALQHHERLDGKGYPQGLTGEAILLEARIMTVADVVEAMASHRPYRPGLGIDKALAEIERGRGTSYDPDVADACLRLFREGRYQLPV